MGVGWAVRIGAALCGVLALASACRSPVSSTPHDVVLIVIDTLRADHLSLYGYERETSPHLERFSADAVTYDNAISPGTWTPTAHGSLFTGRWPSFHGAERVAGDRILATPINPEVPTLAELLRAHGLRGTAFVANTAYMSRVLGFDRGFDDFFDRDVGGAAHMRGVFQTWLSEQRGRLFVFMNLLDPHEPYEPSPPFDTLFPGKIDTLGPNITKPVNDGVKLTPEMARHFVSQYDGEIALTDKALDGIFTALKKAGRYDGALIVVTSDHGELLGEHGLAGHGQMPYEGLVRVPLIVKYPGGRRGGERVGRRVSTMAVFATILQSLGIPAPSGVQAQLLDDPHPVWVEDVTWNGARVVVGYDGDHKLIAATTGDHTDTWLYDLATDRSESNPVRDGTGAAPLREALASFRDAPRPVNAAPPPVIDPEREFKLRALGYIH